MRKFHFMSHANINVYQTFSFVTKIVWSIHIGGGGENVSFDYTCEKVDNYGLYVIFMFDIFQEKMVYLYHVQILTMFYNQNWQHNLTFLFHPKHDFAYNLLQYLFKIALICTKSFSGT